MHNKIEQKVQKIFMCLFSPHIHRLHHYQILTPQSGTFIVIYRILFTQSLSFILGFIIGVAHSLGSYKCTMFWIRRFSGTQSSFTALKFSVFSLFLPNHCFLIDWLILEREGGISFLFKRYLLIF